MILFVNNLNGLLCHCQSHYIGRWGFLFLCAIFIDGLAPVGILRSNEIRTADTFHALKLVPSGLPIGMYTENVCLPGFNPVTGISTGSDVEPGHQPERLKSLDDIPLGKFPEAGLYFLYIPQSSRHGIKLYTGLPSAKM